MLASGFTSAPVSRVLFFGVIASSILASITDTKYLFYINVVPHLWRYKQFWRLLAWQTCYTNSTELLFAAMSIYHMRIIERLWGSRKFAVRGRKIFDTWLQITPKTRSHANIAAHSLFFSLLLPPPFSYRPSSLPQSCDPSPSTA